MNYTSIVIKIRQGVYTLLFKWDMAWKRRSAAVILCYHSIDHDGWRFSVAPHEFEAQMKYMKKHFSPVTLADITQFIEGKKKYKKPIFTVTFDDGYQNIYKTAQMLKKLGVKPTVFMIGNPKRANRDIFESDKPLLTYKELRSLARSGWEIGSHGNTHEILTRCSFERLTYEVKGSKKQLEKNTKRHVRFLSYPKGLYSRGVVSEVLKSDYIGACTMDDGVISTHTNPYLLPRIGVDGTHNESEFKTLASPSVIAFRKMIKNSLIGRIYEKSL